MVAVLGFFGWSIWSTAAIVTIIVFFLIAMANKWLGMMIPFNKWIAWLIQVPLTILLTVYWKVKAGVVLGLILGLLAGVISGFMMGNTGGEE